MSDDVTPIVKGPPRLNKAGHEWGCKCASCRGRNNRYKGQRKQREAAKKAGVRSRRQGDLGNEERYPRTGLAEYFKLEHKYGDLSKFVLDAIDQIELDRAIGDLRPPCVQMTRKGSRKVYCLIDQDDLLRVLQAVGPDNAYQIRRWASSIADIAHQIELKAH